MMREHQNIQSCEYIIIYHDDLYIASHTPEDVLHTLQDKNKINIYLNDEYPHDPLLEQIFVNSRNIWKSYMKM